MSDNPPPSNHDIPRHPFDVVVLTFPDARAASVASHGPLWRDLQQRYPEVHFMATTDPYGCRVGSGGGTLAALAHVHHWQGRTKWARDGSSTDNNGNAKNTLILHAGGQSSRCPTQMQFGKAWTTFPTTTHGLVTPIHIWLDFMFDKFTTSYGTLPAGSVVVIAADTMLRIPPPPSRPLRDNASLGDKTYHNSNAWNSLDDNDDASASVLVLTVPAPLETAQNHGVFVLANKDESAPNDTARGRRCCRRVLQKPSLETLQSLTFNNHQAWIDTGVLIFLSPAARALQHLATGEPHMHGCTQAGLDHLYQQEHQGALASLQEVDMHAFCAQHAVSIDLYAHMLQCMNLADNETLTCRAYQEKFPELDASVAQALYRALAPLDLQVLVEPEGQFLHLGTTAELMDFYTCLGRQANDDAKPLQSFAHDLRLEVRQQVMLACTATCPPSCSPDAVVYHSAIQSSDKCIIGRRSLVEYCHVQCAGTVEIGNGCWVSGLRGSTHDTLVIPNDMVVQELVLSQAKRVYMVLGVNDNVKKATILYGKSWSLVASLAELSATDLWDDENVAKHTLWNAKLHPIIDSNDECCFTKLFSWLLRLNDTDALQADPSLAHWRKCPRMSLAEIREQADAALEFQYREDLSTRIIPNLRTEFRVQAVDLIIPTAILQDEKATEDRCLEKLQELVTASWTTTFNNITAWITNHMFDVTGALAMRFATNLLNLGEIGADQPNAVLHETRKEIKSLQKASERQVGETIVYLLNKVNDFLSGQSIQCGDCQVLAEIFFAVASACTRVCVGVVSLESRGGAKPSAVVDKWVVVTSPARIDLAGGWSDTPPICFDGCTVTGMAVLVDGLAPLACRCRVKLGGAGIVLRVESRSAEGLLVSSEDTELKTHTDLLGFNDPTSVCALLKCALVCLGLLSPEEILHQHGEIDFSKAMQQFLGTDAPVGFEIVSTSILPQGSGMGTSSILAGCVLAAIAECRGVPIPTDRLVHLVLELEQRLTTGGGFQDQVNGLVGGIKCLCCPSGVVQPINITWRVLPLKSKFKERLHGCLHLVYTGKTRLAKNILLKCLKRWSARSTEMCGIVSNLMKTAELAAQAVEDENLDAIGDALKNYWEQKKIMAGPSSGVEPLGVAALFSSLYRNKLMRGGSLCGAGGGGFLVILARDGVTVGDMIDALQKDGVDVSELRWHSAYVDNYGMKTHLSEKDEFDFSLMKRTS